MDLLVNLDVDDFEKAARFYGSAFGLKVGRRFGAFGVEVTSGIGPRSILILWLTKSNQRLRELYWLERG